MGEAKARNLKPSGLEGLFDTNLTDSVTFSLLKNSKIQEEITIDTCFEEIL